MATASEKAASRNSLRAFSSMRGLPSWVWEPAARLAGPGPPLKAWATLMKNSKAREKRSLRRRVEMKTPAVGVVFSAGADELLLLLLGPGSKVTLRWQMAWSARSVV